LPPFNPAGLVARPRRNVDQTEWKEVLTIEIYGNPAAKFRNILKGGDNVVRERQRQSREQKAAVRPFAKLRTFPSQAPSGVSREGRLDVDQLKAERTTHKKKPRQFRCAAPPEFGAESPRARWRHPGTSHSHGRAGDDEQIV